MRETKFRAWDAKEEQMLEVNHLFNLDNEQPIEVWTNYYEGGYRFNPNESELMRYTGLDDINGKPIYENDIVKSSYKYAQPKISQIIMEDGNSYIAGEDLATGNEMLVSDHVDEIEVIGNIRNNPELLEVEK